MNHEPYTLNKLRRHLAFTLVELLVIITIIAGLLAVAVPSYTNSQRKSRDSRAKNDLKAVQQALELYFQTNAKYPTHTLAFGQIRCNAGTDTTSHNWGTRLFCDPDSGGPLAEITYMQLLPKSLSQFYSFYSPSPNSTYVILAKLDNTSDPDIPASLPQACTDAITAQGQSGIGYNYCVQNP